MKRDFAKDQETFANEKASQSQLNPVGVGLDQGYLRAQQGPWTLADEKEKSAIYHREEADKARSAADFLRANLAFDEFVRLVRSGAIQF